MDQGWGAHQHPHHQPLFPFSVSLFLLMPRSIILRPPGGVSGVVCRRYTAREKIAIISKILRIKQQTNVSYRQADATVGVCHTLVFHWHAIRECYNNIDIKTLQRYSAYHGSCGQLESVKKDLLPRIFERRETGLVVSTLSVIILHSRCQLSCSAKAIVGSALSKGGEKE